MAQIELQIPVYVQQLKLNEKPHFRLSPLFVRRPQVTHSRFGSAAAQLRKELRNHFKYFHLNRLRSGELFWYAFHPELEFLQPVLKFNRGKLIVDGPFQVVRFRIRNLNVVCLPVFHNRMYVESTGDAAPLNLQLLEEVVKNALEQEKENLEDEPLQVADYYADKKDYLTELAVKVDIKHHPIPYEQESEHSFFSALFQQADFEGAYEVTRVGQDLNDRFPDELNRAYLQEDLVRRLFQIIFQSRQTPVALVGPEGVGKHTLVEEVVWQYLDQKRETEEPLSSIWHVDPNRVIAGMSIVGQWEKRFESILKFLIRPFQKPDISHRLLIDNPMALLSIGKSAKSNLCLSDVLKPYLEKRQLQLILLATPEQWRKMQETDRSFSALFQVIRIPEPDTYTAVQIILEKRKQLEIQENVKINISALDQLLFIHRNYLQQKALPGSILRLLQQLAVKYRDGKVDSSHVRQEFKAFSGLEESIFDSSYLIDTGMIEKKLGSRLIGQPKAVEALSEVVHLYKAKLNDPGKPVSSLLFIGPTGVGKTQAAKVLAQYLTGNERSLLRFDMNEYIDALASHRLIGDPYQPEGHLTGKVRYQPYGILLFDEIEKAHPTVHDLLLQVLDDGRLTDSLGRTVDFSNTIVIMTSNLGADQIGATPGFTADAAQDEAIYRSAVERFFRPEFINRIDRTVIFKRLGLEDILGIARIQINQLLKRDGFVRRTTLLNITKEVLAWVARRGYDERMGGRALKRQIEQDLTYLSAEQLLKMQSDTPIILDIQLQDDQLKPVIHPLRYARPRPGFAFPEIPREKEGNRFYHNLSREVDQLIESVRDAEEQETLAFPKDWLYFDFKTRLDQIKEQIRTITIAYGDRYYREALATPLRLKRSGIMRRRDIERGTPSLESTKARLFEEAALEELTDSYQYGSFEFDSQGTEFLNHYLDVAFLRIMTDAFLRKGPETVEFCLTPLIAGLGNPELRYLLDKYAEVFDALDLPYETDREKRQFRLEGYGIHNLLKGERGIHLFFMGQDTPVPIQVAVKTGGTPEPEPSFEVIRIYDGQHTLTDLRTGYSNAVNITPQEFKMLLYGGIDVPPGMRSS